MSKDEVFTVVDRCLEMSKCRDLNQKLRACLLDIQTSSFDVNDYMNLLEKLSENGKVGKIDAKLIVNIMMRRNLKTTTFFKNALDVKD